MKQLVVALVLALAVLGGGVALATFTAHDAAAVPCSDGSNNC